MLIRKYNKKKKFADKWKNNFLFQIKIKAKNKNNQNKLYNKSNNQKKSIIQIKQKKKVQTMK